MALRRREIDLSVEREVTDDHGIVRRFRLLGRYVAEGPEPSIPTEELAREVSALELELESALASRVPGTRPPTPVRDERPLAELVETYRPRQLELIDLLLEEREITPDESNRLRQYLVDRASPTPVPDPAGVPIADRPIAAAPLANDRSPSTARPVPELVRLYRIESLKQAGAVRARRQISYEEYMALKRHFAPEVPAAPVASTPE
jgi:hypothetical protein